jgi:hypothetical protein
VVFCSTRAFPCFWAGSCFSSGAVCALTDKAIATPIAVKDNRFFLYVSLLLFVVCEGWKLLLRISWTHRGNARFPRINYSDLGHMAVRFVIPSSLVSTARFRGFKIEIFAERFDIVSALLVKDESRRPFDTN